VVGASFGGLDVQLFARRYPNETAGVVLVDAIAPGWDTQLVAILTPAQVAQRRAIPTGEDVAELSYFRAASALAALAASFVSTT
jgi:pimeloyl-ACP methyl ester carboxylesterase